MFSAQELLDEYIGYRLSNGIRSSTIESEFMSLKAFFYEAINKKYLMKNPVVGIKLPKVYNHTNKVYTPEQVQLILDYCLKNEKFKGYYLVFATLYFTAVRFSDLEFLE